MVIKIIAYQDFSREMSPQQNQTFLQKHLVTIIMIPVIIGVHYGWNYLQYNRALVPAEEQRELPIFSVRINVFKFILIHLFLLIYLFLFLVY